MNRHGDDNERYGSLGAIQRHIQSELDGLRKMLELQEAAPAIHCVALPKKPDTTFAIYPSAPPLLRCETLLVAAEESTVALVTQLAHEQSSIAEARATTETKWKDIALGQEHEITRLNDQLRLLRTELRDAIQRNACAQEDWSTTARVTAARNDELQALLATSQANNAVLMDQVRAQREALDEVQTRLRRHGEKESSDEHTITVLRDACDAERRAKDKLEALLIAMVQAANARPTTHDFRTVLDVPSTTLLHAASTKPPVAPSAKPRPVVETLPVTPMWK
ncbi:hypothetical protein SDRG_02050 [Saprolegnia diclina VS20]|uniref:Uncharacterized protein n=1 Tax=Saprolegnia diclina (strain VS20) TaxID=1156394 RepID=T0QS94_SAPDV|nr:hypothetical protein SDRG_02050 [Saprolegnia diclina VS20]EQC40989.1 hypothetical protein SDRG_02050 [Saprolegnia diclina VS20]|eukprot:XP_008605833.1 hypothetical protein SDRG_02050 [Saprolegnia diclina VS20]